jgi:hypothetical protein
MKRGRYVQYLQIQCSRVARAPGIAADLFCAADRRCDAYSVVVRSQTRTISSGKQLVRATERTPSSLANELNDRAVAALDEASGMPREISARRR